MVLPRCTYLVRNKLPDTYPPVLASSEVSVCCADLPSDLVTNRTPVSLPARVQPPTTLSTPIAPKGRIRKGPRRAKAQQARSQAAPAAQQHQQVQRPKPKTAQDLDAEMEQYRRQGQGRLGLL